MPYSEVSSACFSPASARIIQTRVWRDPKSMFVCLVLDGGNLSLKPHSGTFPVRGGAIHSWAKSLSAVRGKINGRSTRRKGLRHYDARLFSLGVKWEFLLQISVYIAVFFPSLFYSQEDIAPRKSVPMEEMDSFCLLDYYCIPRWGMMDLSALLPIKKRNSCLMLFNKRSVAVFSPLAVVTSWWRWGKKGRLGRFEINHPVMVGFC